MSRDKHVPDEAAAAEALARALDGEGGSPELPDDALEVAALLRYSQDGGELSRERQAEILRQLLADAPQSQARRSRRFDWRRWLLPAGGLASAVAAAIVAALIMVPSANLSDEVAELPQPGPELLEAQLASARAGGQQLDELALAMQSYRDDMYVALSRRYSGAER